VPLPRSLLREFRPTFPWSFTHYQPERWEVLQHVKHLARNDVFAGPPLSEESLRRMYSLSTHPDWVVRFGAKTALHFAGENQESDPEFAKWLHRYLELKRPKRVPVQSFTASRDSLLSRYPFLATPAEDHLARMLSEARALRKELNRPILLFGGVVKGTAMPGGDLDFAVVSRNPLNVPESHQAIPVITPESQDPVSLSILFLGHGIYTGPRRILRDVQRTVVSNVSEEQWERARKNTAKHEAQIHHVVSIFGVPAEKVPLFAAVRAIYATPPPLDVAKRILRVP